MMSIILPPLQSRQPTDTDTRRPTPSKEKLTNSPGGGSDSGFGSSEARHLDGTARYCTVRVRRMELFLYGVYINIQVGGCRCSGITNMKRTTIACVCVCVCAHTHILRTVHSHTRTHAGPEDAIGGGNPFSTMRRGGGLMFCS